MKNILLILLLSFISFLAPAQTLGPVARLNRLSRVLRGYAPSSQERDELQRALQENRLNEFLERITARYLESEAHSQKMAFRLDELFRLRTNGSFDARNPDPKNAKTNNALDYLFAELGRNNKSWDTLLTGKSYRLFNQEAGGNIPRLPGDFGFMAGLVPQLHGSDGIFSPNVSNETFIDVNFDPQDPRLAGAVTTSRFMHRFVNTGLNKNRKRAAVIFRVFLCDSMSAAVSSSQGQDDEIYHLMFPHEGGTSEDDLRAAALGGDALHGHRPDCMACHSKLDPLGQTLLLSPFSLHPLPSPGRLSFPRGGGALRVDIPGRGIGDLAQAISEQPEYAACQVRHFWSWFIDERLPLVPATENLLVSEFNRVGRRTNDFIKILLRLDEFSRLSPPLTENEIRARQVKRYLQRCQDCHRSQVDAADIPDFTQWPIEGSKIKMQTWLRKIESQLDLPHEGENPKMPPMIAPWRTSLSEVKLIKNWIGQGAPNEQGEKMGEP